MGQISGQEDSYQKTLGVSNKKPKPLGYDYAKSLGFSEFLAMNMHLYGDGSFFYPKED